MFVLLVATCAMGAAACGSAEIVTPAPLRVLDTYPSNGAVVSGADVPFAVTFDAPVDEATLEGALLLETTSDAGAPLDIVPTAFVAYLQDSATATFEGPELSPDAAFALTVRAEIVRGTDGQRLVTDFVRRFRTAP